MAIVTNSQSLEESKDPDICPAFTLFRHFSTEPEQESLNRILAEGGERAREIAEKNLRELKKVVGVG